MMWNSESLPFILRCYGNIRQTTTNFFGFCHKEICKCASAGKWMCVTSEKCQWKESLSKNLVIEKTLPSPRRKNRAQKLIQSVSKLMTESIK